MTWLGQAAVLGIDPSRVLRADPVELAILAAAADHAHTFQVQRDEFLARRVINELAEALKRGR